MFKSRNKISALLIVKVVDKGKVVHRFHSATQLLVRKAKRKHQIILSLKEFLSILFHSYPEGKKNHFWKLSIFFFILVQSALQSAVTVSGATVSQSVLFK